MIKRFILGVAIISASFSNSNCMYGHRFVAESPDYRARCSRRIDRISSELSNRVQAINASIQRVNTFSTLFKSNGKTINELRDLRSQLDAFKHQIETMQSKLSLTGCETTLVHMQRTFYALEELIVDVESRVDSIIERTRRI